MGLCECIEEEGLSYGVKGEGSPGGGVEIER